MNKMFKTPFKDFAKKLKRQSLITSRDSTKKRPSTMCDSVVMDEDFLAKLRSIPDANEQKSVVCNQCNETADDKKILMCRCNFTFHTSCVSKNYQGQYDNVSDIINNTKCPNCEVRFDVSDLMYIYSDKCTTSHLDNTQNEGQIFDLQKQIEHVQKELTLCKTSVTRLTQQRDISKRIMTNIVTMIS
jgi:hypothetical protein